MKETEAYKRGKRKFIGGWDYTTLTCEEERRGFRAAAKEAGF